MPTNDNQLQVNHLPKHNSSIQIIESISTTGTTIVLVVTTALFLDWLLGLHIATAAFGQTIINLPTFIALISSCASIFLYKKSAKFQLLGLIPLMIGLIAVV